MEKELKTAAAYIRVSTDRQTELSPDSQLRIIKEYAKQNGYNIPSEYIFREDGLSGKYVKTTTVYRDDRACKAKACTV